MTFDILVDFAQKLIPARATGGKSLPRLWFLTDHGRVPDPVAVLARLPAGSGVILRDYEHERRRELAADLGAAARGKGHLFLVAGDPLLAEAVGADGFHAPQWQLESRDLRQLRIACPHWMITAAAHDEQALDRAAKARADAALVSPVFATQSHPGAPVLGVEGLRRMIEGARLPVIALGGIEGGTVGALAELPIAGIAAIGALSA